MIRGAMLLLVALAFNNVHASPMKACYSALQQIWKTLADATEECEVNLGKTDPVDDEVVACVEEWANEAFGIDVVDSDGELNTPNLHAALVAKGIENPGLDACIDADHNVAEGVPENLFQCLLSLCDSL